MAPGSRGGEPRKPAAYDLEFTEDNGYVEASPVRVARDHFTNTWPVICPLHGVVSRSGKYWTASRDRQEHLQLCELTAEQEETDPSE